MKNKFKNITVITSTRADYGLLFWVLRGFDRDEDLSLSLIVSGTHLSKLHGSTIDVIQSDGFKISRTIDLGIDNSSEESIANSFSIGVKKFTKNFKELDSDLIVLLGDRYEILSAAIAATLINIPIAHLHGGETTQGAFDEAFRHSITKMSYLHFTSTEIYKKRVIQLGEDPERVFAVGALGIENINKVKLFDRDKFSKETGFIFNKYNFLVTFHPATLDGAIVSQQLEDLLRGIKTLKNSSFIFTMANADTNGKKINKIIKNFVSVNHTNSYFFESLGQQKYLSAMNLFDGVIGNSSSAIIEAPSFDIGILNIGDRQLGRVQSEGVINCGTSFNEIKIGLDTLKYSKLNKGKAKTSNPYDLGNPSKKIIDIIKSHEFDKSFLKKKFFDLKFNESKV